MSRRKEIAFANEVLRGVVGSTAHGAGMDGQEDRDEMAVFIEPPECVCGLDSCDHYVYRTQPEGVRSQPGDLDLTMYSLRKFCGLAAQGNPSVLVLLWLPAYELKTELGLCLVGVREAFISRNAGQRFLGYLRSQRMKLTGEKSQQTKRPDLISKHGYDSKFAMHALRLGYQGIELLTDGGMELPIPEPQRSLLRSVRAGEVPYGDVLALIESAESRLAEIVDACDRPADLDAIDRFMVSAHASHWRAAGMVPE